ncbi:MAG: T9SS type A sorting domain-containing protein [Ignavibacteriaceae bacterium]|nr:T9SS type A sorting domain-containing protein [Ignavibacteriaceae bacterium]
MRNIIILFVFINITGYCQNLTGYYPLQIGNVWEYWDPWDSLFIYRDTIIGDSIAKNGITYQVFRREYWSGEIYHSLLRFNNNILYGHGSDSDGVYYDFTKTIGDTIQIEYGEYDTLIYRITADGYAFFYGKLLRYIDFYTEFTVSSYYNVDRVVDSIGLIYQAFEPGFHYYLRGALINGVRYGTITDIDDEQIPPGNFILKQNYPNPFNSTTRIEFLIPQRSFVTLKVYDILGRLVKTLIDQEKDSGHYSIGFNSEGLSGGIYFYTISAGNYKETKKMIFLP